MKKLLLIVLHAVSITYCSFEQYEFGSRAIALGGAFTGIANDCYGVFYNPAGLASLTHNGVSIFISPGPFEFKELSTKIFIANYKSKIGTFVTAFRKFGFELYNELTASISYAIKQKGFSVGTVINLNSLTIRNYGRDFALGIDLGIMLNVFEDFFVGVNFKNINSPKLGERKEPIPQVILSGISYSPVENMTLSFDLQKQYTFNAALSAGIEYRIFEIVNLRFGVKEQPSSYSAGIGIHYNIFKLDYALRNHTQLGLSQYLTFSLELGSKNV